MAVFPENMERLDLNDTRGSLATIQDYIRYMTERIEFSMRNMTKTVSEAGVSSAEVYMQLQELAQAMAALASTVNALSGNITSLQGTVSALNERVTALENAQTS